MNGIVDLYTALKLIDRFDDNNAYVVLKHQNGECMQGSNAIMTVKQVKDKYDLRKTQVVGIRPNICKKLAGVRPDVYCEEYRGGLCLLLAEQAP